MRYVRIAEQWKDLAGKWRVRVVMDDGSTAFLKFDKEQKDDKQVQIDTALHIAREEAARDKAATEVVAKAAEQEKIELVKDLTVAELAAKVKADGTADTR
jgi:hypothetical protein